MTHKQVGWFEDHVSDPLSLKTIRMLALDLDGTLALDDHQISPGTRSALTELAQEGVEVVIATGRRYRTTRYVIENLGLDVYAICNGGALGKDREAGTFHQTAFPQDALANIVEYARAFGLSLFGQRDSHSYGGADFIVDDGVPWHTQMRRYFDDNQTWSARGDLTAFDDEVLVMGGFNDEDVLDAFASGLQEQFPEKYNTIVVPHLTSDYFYCEITQKHVDKWHGLGRLADILDIDAAGVCAVGDQLNDLSMIRAAGHGFAMGNGNAELKRHANGICGNHDEDGLLDVVEYIREHNNVRAV